MIDKKTKCEKCKFFEPHCDAALKLYRKSPGKCCEKIRDCCSECEMNDYDNGFCVRFPPTIDSMDDVMIPITVSSDAWCGEFEPN